MRKEIREWMEKEVEATAILEEAGFVLNGYDFENHKVYVVVNGWLEGFEDYQDAVKKLITDKKALLKI